MNVQTLETGGRIFTYTDHTVTVPKSVTEQMLAVLADWQGVFAYENTYVQRTWGIPSLIVRLDGVISESGTFDAYEVQAGCGWVGYARTTNPLCDAMFSDFISHKWPTFKLLRYPTSTGNPDELLWMERISLEEAIESKDLLWIRYAYWELPPTVRAELIERSLKPVHTHNNKNYGTKLGWWKPVSWHESEHGNLLPWDKVFVLKPAYGFGSVDIMVWKPNDRAGRATRTQIVHALQKNKWMYLQKYIPPMHMQIQGSEYNSILRPFFGYDPQEKKWVPLHGVWTGRPKPNLRIHGASDSLTGPLIFQT